MADILVAYYSRTGVTEGVARILAERLGADLDPVRPAVNYSGGGALCAVLDSLLKRSPKIAFEKDPKIYRLVVVCGPVWAAKLAGPPRSYVKSNRARSGPWAAVWTSASGSEYPEVGEEIATLTGRPLAAHLSLLDTQAQAPEGLAKIADFARSLSSQV